MKIEATYMQCDICRAPYRKPLLDGWTATTYAVNGRQFVQIHRPQCPAGFRQSVVLPEDEESA